jgi:hypothetical protein
VELRRHPVMFVTDPATQFPQVDQKAKGVSITFVFFPHENIK